ncbi:cytochrome p450 family 706 subfamily a polypeptide 3-related [Citrus sinensis]|uniref:Cytochrome p450 family 706 subfamily a polypeptide 3-related n=1 Tax=Citrus sinensis TaxID=2711 RepID=A0ACB8HVD7_CITSI|nr:cytochrome p450 family 706 subfamily a polypeptide 3-related [Citrus sinensis]
MLSKLFHSFVGLSFEFKEHTITSCGVIPILLAATFAISCYAWFIKKPTRSTPPLPPGPRALPLVGNILSAEPNLHRYFTKLSQIYGPIFKFYLGRKLCIVIGSPSLAKQVLKEHDVVFANRDPSAAASVLTYGGKSIGASPEWPKLRQVLVRETMSNTSLNSSSAIRRQAVLRSMKDVSGRVGSPIKVGELMFLTSLDVATRMLWGASLRGEDWDTMAVQFREVLEEMFQVLGSGNISDLFPLLTRFDLQGLESKAKKLTVRLDKIFESLLRPGQSGQDMNEGKSSKDFLQTLLELQQQGDYSLSMDQIKALFMDVAIGSTDTTSITVEWAMSELLQKPEVMRKARNELEQVVARDSVVEEFHLAKLPYLEAIVKETLRLHPPAPLLTSRRPSATSNLSGYTIPKGSTIFINAWAIQRNPEVWENPQDFQPDRFLEDVKIGDFRGNNFNYLPFGSGRRICPGIPLAEKIVPHVLANLLHLFEWSLPEGTKFDLSDKLLMALKKSEPLVVIPTPRSLSALEHCN